MRARTFAVAIALALGACSSAKLGDAGQNIQSTIVAAKPVVNTTACEAQQAANLATAALEQTHNAQDAAASASASALLGLLCYTTKSAVAPAS